MKSVTKIWVILQSVRSWGPPSLLYNGYRVFPRGVKCGRGVTLTPHPLLAPRSWEEQSYTSTPLWATTGPVTGLLYLYYFSRLPARE